VENCGEEGRGWGLWKEVVNFVTEGVRYTISRPGQNSWREEKKLKRKPKTSSEKRGETSRGDAKKGEEPIPARCRWASNNWENEADSTRKKV